MHSIARYLETLRAVLMLAIGCSVVAGCRASMAPDAGFVPQPELLHPDARLPFDAVWLKEGVDLKTFKKVFVAPIDTTHLLKLDWWDRANMAPGDQKQQADRLAGYFREKVIKAFQDDPNKSYQVVDTADPDALLVELAIVEVVPTKVWLNAIAYVAAGAVSQGTTAFEGRLKDGKTTQVLAEFKDREYGQFDLVSINDLTWYRHSEHTLRAWSDELVKVCNRAPTEAVAPMSTVTLRMW